MAQSRRNSKAKAAEGRPGRPYVRHPWERVRTAISFDPEQGLTHQSFKDECDIEKIVATYARTGIVPRTRGNPQFGDAPEIDLFEAACVHAEIRSKEEEGWTMVDPFTETSPQTRSEAAGDDFSDSLGDTLGEGAIAPETAADDESRG